MVSALQEGIGLFTTVKIVAPARAASTPNRAGKYQNSRVKTNRKPGGNQAPFAKIISL